jgi:hypothetical protein
MAAGKRGPNASTNWFSLLGERVRRSEFNGARRSQSPVGVNPVKAGRSEGPRRQISWKNSGKVEREVSETVCAMISHGISFSLLHFISPGVGFPITRFLQAEPLLYSLLASPVSVECSWFAQGRSGLNPLPGSTAGCGRTHVRPSAKVTARNHRDRPDLRGSTHDAHERRGLRRTPQWKHPDLIYRKYDSYGKPD